MAKIIEKKNEKTLKGVNAICVNGVVKKVLFSSEKVASYIICNTIKSPKGNNINTFININEFNPSVEYEDGDNVIINGVLSCDIYEDKDGTKKYNMCVIGAIELDEETPFE